jgi:hypothetical protein
VLSLISVISLLAGIMSDPVSGISLPRAITIGPTALLIAFRSSVSVLTTLSGAPETKKEKPSNVETKQEKSKININNKETNEKKAPLRESKCKLVPDFRFRVI